MLTVDKSENATILLVVYTSSPPVPFEPPVAKPDTLNVIFPEFSFGDNHSKIHDPDVVLEFC